MLDEKKAEAQLRVAKMAQDGLKAMASELDFSAMTVQDVETELRDMARYWREAMGQNMPVTDANVKAAMLDEELLRGLAGNAGWNGWRGMVDEAMVVLWGSMEQGRKMWMAKARKGEFCMRESMAISLLQGLARADRLHERHYSKALKMAHIGHEDNIYQFFYIFLVASKRGQDNDWLSRVWDKFGVECPGYWTDALRLSDVKSKIRGFLHERRAAWGEEATVYRSAVLDDTRLLTSPVWTDCAAEATVAELEDAMRRIDNSGEHCNCSQEDVNRAIVMLLERYAVLGAWSHIMAYIDDGDAIDEWDVAVWDTLSDYIMSKLLQLYGNKGASGQKLVGIVGRRHKERVAGSTSPPKR